MLQRVRLELTFPRDSFPDQDWGAILHGVLLEQLTALDPDYVPRLHDRAASPRPFTQAVSSFNASGLQWRITSLQEEFSACLDRWLQQLPAAIAIRQIGREAAIRRIDLDETPLRYQDLVETHFVRQPSPRRLQLRFGTPAAFRVERRYVLFPEPRLLWQNALRKWEAFCPEYRLGEPSLAEDLAEICTVSRYRLETVRVLLGEGRLSGFVGTLHLSLGGSEEGRRLVGLLADYLTYCGAGIKTALGMGMVEYILERPFTKSRQEGLVGNEAGS